ncbi:MAG: hypothetical protein EXR99_08305 [Gemmataceae bacterium]|nr:hypothetical protein [Gemmataceae bacterium]
MDPLPNPGYSTREKEDEALGEFLKRLERLENAVATLQSSQANAAEKLETPPATGQEPTEVDSSEEAKPRKWPTLFGTLRWFFRDVAPEIRGMLSMFFDPRYELGVWNRVAIFTLLALVVTTAWWVPFASIPIAGFCLDRVMMILTAYFLIKLLIGESRRYRQHAPALPESLRWPGKGERE